MDGHNCIYGKYFLKIMKLILPVNSEIPYSTFELTNEFISIISKSITSPYRTIPSEALESNETWIAWLKDEERNC